MGTFAGDWLVELAGPQHGGALDLRVAPGEPPPGRADDGELTVVFDGVLDDRSAFARRWGLDADRDDARLVLDAFRRAGERALPTLRGRFSLVVSMPGRGELLALRDPVGNRALFFAAVGSAVVVGRSLAIVLGHRGVGRRVDPLVAAGEGLLGLAGRPHETIFRDVRRVPPGHLLRARERHVALERYWDLPDEVAVDGASDRFAELFEQSMRRCGDGRFGVLLSGGIDSATVATAATRVSRERGVELPLAISVLSHMPVSDESRTQYAVANRLGIEVLAGRTDEILDVRALMTDALALASRCAWPPGPSLPATEVLCRRALADGCDAILTGDGGDEWLMPSWSWAVDCLARGDLRSLRWLVGASSYWIPQLSRRELARAVVVGSGLRPLARAAAVRVLARVSPQRLRAMRATRFESALQPWEWLLPEPGLRREVAEWWVDTHPPQPPTRYYRRELRALMEASFTSAMMEDHFEMGRRLGAEVLRPFWDADLVSFLGPLPPQTLIRGGRAKALARDYVAPDLPFAERWPAKTFGDPVRASLVEREGKTAWDSLGGARVLAELGLVDPEPLERWFETSRVDEPRPEASAIWDVISLENWLRTRLY